VRVASCLFFVVLIGNLSSACFVQMNSTDVIPVSLSARNHNRVGIVGDRIKKAFFRGTDISVDIEETSGQIYVQALRCDCPNTTLSIVSTSGVLQDLELCFEEKPSEIILLQSSCELVEEEPVAETSDLTNLVEGFLKGNIPEGYVSFEDHEAPKKINKWLSIQRFSRLVNDNQIVFAYRLHNKSSEVLVVHECNVNVLDGDWVFLDRYKLKPNECALVLIGCYR